MNGRTQQPIAAVQVFIVGASLGTLTRSDGRFLLTGVPAGTHTLQASLIGFESVTRSITIADGESRTEDFELSEQALALDEIVVTGTAGQARRREVGTSIAQINVAEADEPAATVDQLLAGRAAGMSVLQSGGMAGSGAQIRLRGNGSIGMSNQPLVYIDGVRIRSEGLAKAHDMVQTAQGPNDVVGPLNDISPDDIERIEIVKGPAAAALYGTEAAAGVIQIFTKRGSIGEPTWTFQATQGVDRVQPFGFSNAPYLYIEPWLRDGWQQRYATSVAGGGGDLQYFASLGYDDNQGVLPNDAERKIVVRGNFTFSPRKALEFQWNTSITRQAVSNTSMGNNPVSLALNAFRSMPGRAANYVGSDRREDIDRVLDFRIQTDVDRLVTGFTANYTPWPALANRLTIGLDHIGSDMRQVRPFGFVGYPQGAVSSERWTNETLTVDYVGTYSLSLSDALAGSFSWGGQAVTTEEISVMGRGEGLPGPVDPTVSSAAELLASENRFRVINGGVFLQSLFGFRDRLFLTTALRVDGNSAFGESFGLQPYPRATLSYVVSDEAFWPQEVGQLKLRAAWGHAGRAPGAFDAVRTWNPVPWLGQTAFSPRNVGNEDLGPERTVEIEAGFDGSFLDDRLSVDFSYYNQQTTDALLAVQQIPSRGFRSSQLANVGAVRNRGVEAALGYTILRQPAVTWDIGLNLHTNDSRVTEMGGATPFSTGGGWIEEGGPVPGVRARRILNPDAIAEPEIEEDYLFGSNLPTHTVGVSTSIELPRRATVSLRGEYMGGHYIRDGATTNLAQRGVLPLCSDAYALLEAGDRERLSARERWWCDSRMAAEFVYPADFFRLRDVTVQVPIGFVFGAAQSATFTLSAQNLWTWKNKGFLAFDPEMAGNSGMASGLARSITEHIPPPVSLSASLRVRF